MIPLHPGGNYMGLDVVHTVTCDVKISGGSPRLRMATACATDGCEHER